MFKVGDKVKIANKEELKRYSWVNPIMLKYAGCIATITKIQNYGNIYLDIDNKDWVWRNIVLYPYTSIDTSQFKVIFNCGAVTCYKKSDIIIYETPDTEDENNMYIISNGEFVSIDEEDVNAILESCND